ncbi:hypothetical protein Chor_015823 [Crotalus horridus]
MVAREELRVVRCGGSWLSGCRAAFSADSKYLLCASGDYIKVYSTLTEECLHILQGHTNLVTGIQLNPQNHLQLYSSSLDGTIKLWDFMDGILIKTFVVGSKLFAFYTLASLENSAFIIISNPNDEKSDTFQLMTVKLPKTPDQEVEANELEMVLNGVSQSPKCTAFGRDGEYVVSVWKLRLVVCFFKKNKIYRRNFNHKREYTFSTMHWHHNEVIDLAFSVEGTSLLSGGIESVLVQWRDGSDAKKEFLPRLGATIQHISVSPDGTLLCTSHSDNSSDVKTGLIVDPRTKALVLNGKPGHLQFYSLQNDKLLYNLDVVQQEYIHQSGLDQIDLMKAAFHSKGDWLATVEQRQGSGSEVEMQLKLWAYSEQTQSFTLNTRINTPHEDCITAMCFRDTDGSENVTLVTTSNDGHFKVWMLLMDKDSESESITWTCDFVGSYHNYQATNCCFSEDGSLLAVSFDKTITLWDSETWDLKCTFCHPPGTITSLCFGRLISSKYLLGTTSSGFLCCWNLLNCSYELNRIFRADGGQNVIDGFQDTFLILLVEWSAQLHVNILQPDHLSENIVAISQHSEYSDGENKETCLLCVEWLIPVVELMTFSTKTPEERLTPSSRQLAVEENISMTPFYLLLGKHRQQMKEGMDIGKVPVQNLLGQESPAVKELLHTPAHVLPSASFLCPLFIHSLLVPRTSTSEIADEVEMLSDSEEKESEEEYEVTEVYPEASQTAECFGESVSKLSKLQERELRKLRKLDYSWASGL